MDLVRYLILASLLILPLNLFAGGPFDDLDLGNTFDSDREITSPYDLRNRNTFVQITNNGDENPLCIHVQIFQQDQGCTELDFNDQLTSNDTVVYDMDNLVRNNGSDVPITLGDDSYGYVAVSAVTCADNNDDGVNDLIGNYRIIDDSGYEYRMNMISEDSPNISSGSGTDFTTLQNPIIRFNTVDGANQADIYGYVYQRNRDLAGNEGTGNENDDKVRNITAGATFSVFQLDEDEERLSCDVKTFACGPGKNMYYGVNDDYPPSIGNNLLCEGGGLQPDQNHGYISLENGFTLGDEDDSDSEDMNFVCVVGLNNGNGTGSMAECSSKCIFGVQSSGICNGPPG